MQVSVIVASLVGLLVFFTSKKDPTSDTGGQGGCVFLSKWSLQHPFLPINARSHWQWELDLIGKKRETKWQGLTEHWAA